MIKKILILFTSVYFSSCVVHKDIVNFQGNSNTQSNIEKINKEPYKVQINDILYIDLKSTDAKLVLLFNNSTASQVNTQYSESSTYFSGYSVDKQGFITLPYLNKINVLGYTTMEISQKIKSELSRFFVNTDDVFVNVKLAGFKYTILGEVGSAGTKYLYQNSVNIIEAIANAGDIPITGNKKQVQVLRNTKDGIKKYEVDFTNIAIFESDVFYLEPNDIIYVPPLKQKTLGTGTNGVQTLTTVISVLSLLTTTFLLIKNK
jgi:polysaccharide export outer membrane protein